MLMMLACRMIARAGVEYLHVCLTWLSLRLRDRDLLGLFCKNFRVDLPMLGFRAHAHSFDACGAEPADVESLQAFGEDSTYQGCSS